MNSLAPIVLFVYNRPWHTEQTLKALSNNEFAKDSILYIYADGPKKDASDEIHSKIKQTRELIRKSNWCKEVHIIESETNKGLANSIIDGVSNIINKHGKIIVLEDDIVTAKGFLKFLNEGLSTYENENNVAGISGWSFPIDTDESTYFSRVGACWGWATWKRVWDNTNFNTSQLLAKLKETKRINEYNVDGSYDYFTLLSRQESGKVDSWAIRFYTSYFLNNGLFLFPNKSLVQNIGFDGTGTHYTAENLNSITRPSFEKESINLIPLKPVEQKSIREKIRTSFSPKRSLYNALKNLIRKLIRE